MPETKREAEKALRDLELEAWRTRHGLGSGVADVEVETLQAVWQAEIQARCRPRTWADYAQSLAAVLGWLRDDAKAEGRPVPRVTGDVRLADVRRYAAERLGLGRAARTVQKSVGALRQMLTWGAEEGMIPQNPLQRWKPLKGPQRRPRRALSAFEIAKLLSMSQQPFRDIWMVLLGTGLRAGELVAMEWRDVDVEGGELHVRAECSKSKRPRTIPLRADLLAILRKLRVRCPGVQRRVFVQRNGNPWGGPWGSHLSRRLKVCLRAAGLDESVDLHCLRHTFGSHLVRAGADVKSVQALLGHSSATVTLDIYAHEFGDAKREAVELIELPSAPHARPGRTGTAP